MPLVMLDSARRRVPVPPMTRWLLGGHPGEYGTNSCRIGKLWLAWKEIFGASRRVPSFKLRKVGRARKRDCHTLEGALRVCGGGYGVRSLDGPGHHYTQIARRLLSAAEHQASEGTA